VSKVLVIGSGGREHALAWKLSQSPEVTRVIVAPGNSGMPAAWIRWPAVSRAVGSPNSQEMSFKAMAEKAVQEKIDLVVIGPDNPLAEGIVDVFEASGLRVFGPRAAAAQIEASKSFAKDVMKAANVPTAKYWVAKTEEEARKILRSVPWGSVGGSEVAPSRGWVVKADGLAMGKGVRVCSELAESLTAVSDLSALGAGHGHLSGNLLPGKLLPGKLLIEERLSGEELSWMAFCDGERCALLEPVRDYKRLLDSDLGPNTGGMGSFSPVPGVPESWREKVKDQVFLPVLREMKKRGAPFQGLLYAGLMANFDSDEFWVLEFNARFGDPETQAILPRLKGDLYPWLRASAQGDLSQLPSFVPFKEDAAVVVIAASGGYPDSPRVGKPIQLAGDAQMFYAGVKSAGKNPDGTEALLTSGGRVLGALGTGATLELAREFAYSNLSKIRFEEMHHRTDIGKIKRKS
jgi:phosphoribosylamine--glycine ligase